MPPRIREGGKRGNAKAAMVRDCYTRSIWRSACRAIATAAGSPACVAGRGVIEVAMAKHFQSAGRTDIGKARRRNEDAILVGDETGLWAVADGLGGHAAGDYASNLIVERLAAVPRSGSVFDFVEVIEDTLAGVNADLRRAARERDADIIGSTVVVLVYDRHCMLCGWAGDSRGYCCDKGRLVQLTRDHLYGVEADTIQWSGGPAQSQPGGGVLTRAVGAEDALFLDWAVADNRPGMQFVLCSDGINKEMSDAEIEAACARHASPDGVLGELFETSMARGARDNLSAVVVVSLDGAAGEIAAMDGRLREANRALRTLDDAHRLGKLARDNYRAQRRRLLGALVEDAAGDTRDERGQTPAGDGAGPSGWKRWFRRG